MTKNVLVLKHFESPKDAGVYHRLMCLTGGNKGESFILLGNRIVLGRSEKADIRINDTKASREHAELIKSADNWFVTDLGSQNGIVVNDTKINQAQLKEGDKIIIGQTVFKFAKVEVNSKANVVQEANSKSEKNKGLVPLIIIIGLILYVILPGDEDGTNKSTSKKIKPYQDVTNEYAVALQKRNANENKKLKQDLNIIYHRGLRELQEKNYYRAIQEFNLALIMAPGDPQAEYYLRRSKEELDKSIEGYIANAQRDEQSLKYKSAVISYCAILRLLHKAPEDTRFKNAEKQIKKLEAKIGMENGETDCLKK